MPAVIRFNVVIVVVVVVFIIQGLAIYVVAIATSLDAPSLLSLRRRLYRHAIATPPPLSPCQRLSHCASLAPAVGCCIVTSLAAPVPLLSCRRLSRCVATSLVASPPLSLRRCLSCGASLVPAGCRFANYLDVPPSFLSRRLIVALLPLSLHRSLSLCHLSHCAAVSLGHRPSQPQ